jgi:quinol monooxygenase YgiN
MFTRLNYVDMDAARMDRVIELWRAGIGGYEGLTSGIFLLDGDTGHTLSIVMFETEALMRANETGGALKEMVAQVGDLRLSTPQLSFYEGRAEVPAGTAGGIGYARVIYVTIKPECLDQVAAGWPGHVATYQAEAGFRGARLLSDHATGRSISYSLWGTKADVEANESSGALMATVEPYKEMIAVPPAKSYWDVAVVIGEG